MVQQVTQGVSISVESFYQEEHSNAVKNEFMHAYRITIQNLSPVPVQLISRHWYMTRYKKRFRQQIRYLRKKLNYG